jgi:hypothetical protein
LPQRVEGPEGIVEMLPEESGL